MIGPMLSAGAIRTLSLPICLKTHTALSSARHYKGEHQLNRSKTLPQQCLFFQILHVLHLCSKITNGVWSPQVSFCCLWSLLHFCWHKSDAALLRVAGGVRGQSCSPASSPVVFGRQRRKIHLAWNLMLSAGAGRLNHMQYLCTIKPENPYQSHFLTSTSAMSQIYKPLISDFIHRNASWLTLPSQAARCFWFNLD